MAMVATSPLPSYVLMLMEEHSEQTDYNVVRSETDNAMAKTRTRFTIPIVNRTCELQVNTKADLLAFREWWEDVMKGGSLWWSYLDCVTGTTSVARFKEPLKWSQQTDKIWKASASFETIGY